MDSKKTNLTPELKEIYDRVMNTSSAPQPTPTVPTTPASPTSGAPTTLNSLSGQPIVADAMPANPLNPPTLPISPIPPVAGPSTSGITAPAESAGLPSMPSMPASPDTMAGLPTPAEQALTNTPARPISEGNTFAFNGTVKNETPANGAQPAAGAVVAKKAKISLPILIILGIALIAVWGVFWALILGIIQR